MPVAPGPCAVAGLGARADGTRHAPPGCMTAMQIVAALGFAVGALGGCSSEGDPRGTCDVVGGSSTATATFGGVEYRVTGGFSGDGNGNSLQIDRYGAVTRQTPQRGTERGQLDQATLDNVIADARAAEIPTLCATYRCAGCADDFVHEVTAQLDNAVLVVQVSEFGDPPDRLNALLDLLQELLDRRL